MKQAGAGKVNWGEHCVNSHRLSLPRLPREQWDGSSAGEAAPRGCQSPASTGPAQSRGSSALAPEAVAVRSRSPWGGGAESRSGHGAPGESGQLEQGVHSLTQGGHTTLGVRESQQSVTLWLSGPAFQSRRLTLGQLWWVLSLLPACPAGAAAGISSLHSHRQFAARGWRVLKLELLYLSLLSCD